MTQPEKRPSGRAPAWPTGAALLHTPSLNKDSAFSMAERDALGLHGLLPPAVLTQDQQVRQVMENFNRKPNALEQYIFLCVLQDRNEALFYRVLMEHIETMMPVVYTPTVGEACQQYGRIMRRSRGMYFSIQDRGRVAEFLANSPREDVAVVVVTDGERILGLGDLGANGMGIPVGKLSLYTACAGVDPARCLPVTLDTGTNNESLLSDDAYIGLRQPRVRGEDYDHFLDEFITAVNERWPGVLVQFEDFANRNAFRLLHRYQDRVCCYNDDMQGTASVALAGVYAALGEVGGSLAEQKFLFLGAGEAGTGIAHLLVRALVAEGVREEDARQRCWFVDSQGLVVKSRGELQEHKRPFAHEHEPLRSLREAVDAVRPTALLGVSGQAGAFDEEVLRAMASNHRRPLVFALSNPTSKAECTAEAAYRYTGGRALFASGSPFEPVTLEGRTHVPGQGNNAYIFPGIGLAVTALRIRRVPDELFLVAARALAGEVVAADLEQGALYPPLRKIRAVSLAIAVAVAEEAVRLGLVEGSAPSDIRAYLESCVYHAHYRAFYTG